MKTEISELNINSRELLRALTLVGRVVPNNPLVTVLENVKVEFSGAAATFTADNFKQNITVTVPCGTFGDDGEFLIPHKKITELLKTLPDAPLSIVHTRNGSTCNIVVNVDGKKFKVTSEPIEDFPKAKVFSGNQIALPAQQLKEAINFCLATVSTDDLRPATCGLYFNTEVGDIVSTNGMNLTRYQMDKPIDTKPFLITSEFARMISELIVKDQEVVTLEVSEKSARISADDQVITSSLIDERFPDYGNAIPESSKMEGIIDLEEWVTLLKRSALFSSGKVGLVRNKFEGGVLTAVSEDMDYGNEAIQEMNYEGNIDIEIGLSGKQLTNILKMISGKATIGVTAPNRAVMIYPEKTLAKKLTILSMPLMLSTAVL
jgi:DNA polymerase-3 subunit beta